jgi:hypothetical protein
MTILNLTSTIRHPPHSSLKGGGFIPASIFIFSASSAENLFFDKIPQKLSVSVATQNWRIHNVLKY